MKYLGVRQTHFDHATKLYRRLCEAEHTKTIGGEMRKGMTGEASVKLFIIATFQAQHTKSLKTRENSHKQVKI